MKTIYIPVEVGEDAKRCTGCINLNRNKKACYLFSTFLITEIDGTPLKTDKCLGAATKVCKCIPKKGYSGPVMHHPV